MGVGPKRVCCLIVCVCMCVVVVVGGGGGGGGRINQKKSRVVWDGSLVVLLLFQQYFIHIR